MVGQAAFAERLELGLTSSTPDVEGIFGPNSISWRVARESVIFAAGGRAALLQLAHPFVAYAVDEHSATRRDPVGRFTRTFASVFDMIFGERARVEAAAHRVRAIHGGVSGHLAEASGPYAAGDRYAANEESALAWVFATLIDSAVLIHDLVLPPLTPDERERYYRESLRFAALFGVGQGAMPETWQGFRAYMQRMTEEGGLEVTRPGAELGRFLMRAQNPQARRAVEHYRAFTTGLMPRGLREPFGLHYGVEEQRRFWRGLRLLRRVYPRLPGRMRHIPAYIEACHRLGGRPRPDRIGRTFEAGLLWFLAPRRGGCPVHIGAST